MGLFRQANFTFKQCYNFPSFLILFLLFWTIYDYSTLNLWIITIALDGKADAFFKSHIHLRQSSHVELMILYLADVTSESRKEGRSKDWIEIMTVN